MSPTIQRRMIQTVLAVLVLGLGVLALLGLKQLQRKPEQRETIEFVPLVTVQAVSVGDVPITVEGFGTVEARVEVQLVSQVGGQVVELHPALIAGGFFEAREMLVRIDPADYELAVARVQAELAQAQAIIIATDARIVDAQARVDDAQSEFQRLTQLGATGAASKREVRRADLAYQAAQAQHDEAHALRKSTAARRDAAQVALRQARLNLQRTELALPFNGRITRKDVDVGQYVGAGQGVARAYGTDVMQVPVPLEDAELAWFDVPGESSGIAGEAAGAAKGSAVTLHTEFAGRSLTWRGRVMRLKGQVDPITRMVHVIVEVTDPLDTQGYGHRLMPGMFVRAHIHGNTLMRVATLPRHSLRDNNTVWLVRDAKLRFHCVEPIRKQHTDVLVRGLVDGLQVITSGLDVYTDGMRVHTAEPGE